VAGELAEIGDLVGRADRVIARFDRNVRGADQGEFALVGNDEDDAVVAVLQDEGMVAVMQARHDDVATLDQAHALGRLHMRLLVEEVLTQGPHAFTRPRAVSLTVAPPGPASSISHILPSALRRAATQRWRA